MNYKQKECSTKRAHSEATLRPEAKQGAISAFALWIRETGQKPDRDGGH